MATPTRPHKEIIVTDITADTHAVIGKKIANLSDSIGKLASVSAGLLIKVQMAVKERAEGKIYWKRSV